MVRAETFFLGAALARLGRAVWLFAFGLDFGLAFAFALFAGADFLVARAAFLRSAALASFTKAFTNSSLRMACQPEMPLRFAISDRSFEVRDFKFAAVIKTLPPDQPTHPSRDKWMELAIFLFVAGQLANSHSCNVARVFPIRESSQCRPHRK